MSDAIREERCHKSRIINGIMEGGHMWGGGGAIGIALLLYIILENKEIGRATLEATLLSGAVARGIGVITGRARPYISPNNALNFKLCDGLDYARSSMPSGHSAVAFAFASVVDKMTPRSRVKTVVLYSLAGITAISRVYHERHWFSDVIMGSTIGYLIGHRIGVNRGKNL